MSTSKSVVNDGPQNDKNQLDIAPSCHVQQDATATQLKEALAVLFAFRLINVICTRTFFQPDEYYQALEPAWQLVFGPESGAWMTWVRSTISLWRYHSHD